MSYEIDPSAPLDAETRRVASEQIGKAIDELSAPGPGEDPHEAIHEARKRFKKLRALFRLVRDGDEDFCRAGDVLYRDTARTLSSVRDRTALIEALDALEKDLGGAATAEAFASLRAALLRKRDAAVAAQNDLDERIAGTLAALETSRDGLVCLVFAEPVEDAADILARGYGRTHGSARAALKRSAKTRAADDLHELRKHVKYMGFHLGLLAPLWPEAFAPVRAAAMAIADMLGRDHDYAVFRAEAAASPASFGARRHAETVLALMERRQAELQAEALAAARRLLAESPKAAAARIRRLHAAAADAAALATAPAGLADAAE